MVDHFKRLRDGDRFWYRQMFHGRELQAIEDTTLADVTRRNNAVTDVQGNVFFEPSLSAPQPAPGNEFDLADIATPGRSITADLTAADRAGAAPVTDSPRDTDRLLPRPDAGLPTATVEGQPTPRSGKKKTARDNDRGATTNCICAT